MSKTSIAFVGGGNMSRALIAGMLANDHFDGNFELHAADPGKQARDELQKLERVCVYTRNEQAIGHADCVVFAVKPQIMKSVCLAETGLIQSVKPLVISVAAGITSEHISTWFQGYERIVRAMPNTPALVGAGASGLYATNGVTLQDKALVNNIFSGVGIAEWVDDESLIDLVTALSGSGPAYFFYILEAMENYAIDEGLTRKAARNLARHTAFGAAKMSLAQSGELAQLRRQVTSPGGTTEAALRSFANNKLVGVIESAMVAANTRSQQLAKEFGE